MLRNFLSLLCILLGAGMLNAQSLWVGVPASAAPSAGERRIVPQKFKSYRLELSLLQPALEAAPEAFTPAANADNLPMLEVPTPDGKMSRFQIVETPVMAPGLQEKYPDIRCYTGKGVDDPTARIKLDLTPWGFHAMVTSANQGSYFIDPMVHGDRDFYIVYYKKDFVPAKDDSPWTCGNAAPDAGEELSQSHAHTPSLPADFQGDTKLRRYRLALACTGEYSTFFGGTKPLVLAAMNTSMNRVNGVYERDFAVTMQLIPNNDLLIYLNAATDPYTNNDGGTMLGQNQTTITNVIGAANYDMGHVFSTGGGGVAFLSSVCSAANKSRGVTGSGSPVGDPFDIDYVVHEMGHQFSGNHTFNHCGSNNAQPSAVEPGSGTTIMAYAGICGADNVAAHSEDIFHGYNMIEMSTFIYSGGGNTCPVKITTSNNNPVVSAGANYTIPKSTPFALTAVGSDMDGDTLTYTWEQIDNGNAASPPTATTAVGPLFRSYKGNTSPTRIFPRLQDLVNNINPVWEELPGVARTMNFRVTARDNDWFAGCTDEDDMTITVSAASGPFLVTAPNTNILWNVGTLQTVTWDVANTTAAPVSCANVRILLSTDGGFTYPVVLAASEPNDGSAAITVPNNVGTTCRVKVEGIGNIFFDISNTNFRIEAPVIPTFFLNTNVPAVLVCAGDDATFTVDLTTVLGFNTPTDITVTGAPAGATLNISPNPVVPAGTGVVTINNLTPAMAGVYTLNIQAVAGVVTRTSTVTMTVLPGAPSTANLSSPANGATGLATVSILSWSSTFAATALVEVATNPSFSAGSIVSSQTVTGNTASVLGLTAPTVYYWRVRSTNDCGNAAYSTVYAFQVGSTSCGNIFSSTDVPKVIDQANINTVVSNLDVPTNNVLEDVNVSLAIMHSYIGDVSARLVSPANDTILLFDQPGVPATDFGCAGDNANLTFDSQAAQNAGVLENQCNGVAPALNGTFQSIASLNQLNGKNAQGTWKLLVTDNYPEDGGSLTAWSLSACFPNAVAAGNLLANNPLTVLLGSTEIVPTANLQMTTTGTATQGQYIVLSLPTHGTLSLNGVPLGIGGTFTQADIDAGLLTYTNNGDPAAADNFHFDGLDANNNGWIHDAIFNINIQVNNLAATAAQTQEILCFNGATGEITVSATGLNGVYSYSLNGSPDQSSNVFGGLSAGTYTVIVTGQLGFTVSANTVTINNAPQILLSASAVTDDVTVVASGGTGALEYSTNGIDFQPGDTFLDLPNGVYVITVRDENGCTATTEVIVAVNSLIVAANLQNAITCAGGSNGSISVNVGGGQSPYSYSLNGGLPQLSNVFSDLSAGTYTIEVTDDLGFSATSAAIVLSEPTAIIASASAALNVVSVTASGGTGALEYSLNGGGYQSSNIFSNLTNGTYNVSVRDQNGCTVETIVVVDVPPLTMTATFTASLNCFGATDGVVTANVAGGIPPYEYKLDNGVYQSSNVFNGLSAGSYLVWSRDAVGTEVSFSVTIAQPTQVVVNVTVTGNDGTVSFSGGVPPYAYTTDAPNPNLQNLPNGTYIVIVSDANSCTATTTFTVNIPPLAWSAVTVNVSCSGLSNGMLILTAAGGTAPYEYSLNGGAFQTDNTFAGLAAGTYTVTIRDADGFETSGSATIGSPTPVALGATVSGNSVTATATGGTSPYQYSLNNGPQQTSGIFNNLAPGSYTVVATDANGCIASVSNLVVVSSVIEPSAVWGLQVSPNPGAGLFQLVMQQAPQTLRAEVFDGAGRLLRSMDFAPNGGQFSTAIDLRDLPNGTYILRLTDGQNWGGVRLSKVN